MEKPSNLKGRLSGFESKVSPCLQRKAEETLARVEEERQATKQELIAKKKAFDIIAGDLKVKNAQAEELQSNLEAATKRCCT